jgi:ABC-type multidrug transport system ATPase subunit
MSPTGGVVDQCDFTTVAVQNVSRHYGRRRALAGVSLECRAGTITGLFGPNGAGKSTLLGVLSTLLAPGAGEVRYGAKTAAGWGDVLRSRIGVLGHDLFLYGDLSARENLRFFGRMYGLDNRSLDARVNVALTSAVLEARADDRVAGFSRGMRQRLAVERALLHGPRLVLLDEPFTGLDDASVERLARRLADLRASGAIVIMATHDLDIAEGLIDDAVCLIGGRLIAVPSGTDGLRQRYRRAVEAAG